MVGVAALWRVGAVLRALALIAALVGVGYVKGCTDEQGRAHAAQVKALEAQKKELLAQAQQELDLALVSQRERLHVRHDIDSVSKPRTGCELRPKCLQYFDAIVRKASSRPGAD